MESLSLNYKGKKIRLDANKCEFISKGIGLMFKPKITSNLLFEFRKSGNYSITSVFVFFPFLAIWIDENNKVLETKIVKPFNLSIRPNKKFRRLVEVPVNDENTKILDFFRR